MVRMQDRLWHAGPVVRDRNPHRMNKRLWASWLPLCMLLAACNAPTSLPSGNATPPSASAMPGNGDSLQWQARLSCVDCDAIQVRLQLKRDGDARGYVLTEVYVSADGDARFAERGQWRQRDERLRLRAQDGANRNYALLPDGRLQSLDRHGHPLSAREEDFLLPVADAAGR